MQAENPDVFVLSTGKTISIREFCNFAFKTAEIELEWTGKGVDEKGICKKTGNTLVKVNPEFFRPAEVEILIGNPEKAQKELGWKAKTTVEELAELMVKEDIKRNEGGFSF
jgi:GDPmannose 4,6-dehydratase